MRPWMLYILIGVISTGALAAAHFYLVERAYDRGYDMAMAEAREQTERAINELGDEADQASLHRALCRERGGLWNYTRNECDEGNP